MSCCGCCEDKPHYECGKPTVSGGTVMACFKEGRLFRVEKGKTWYYYNDTQSSRMHVEVTFGPGSKVEALGKTTVRYSNPSGESLLALDIMPLETEKFVKGVKNGFEVKMTSQPFSEAEKTRYHQTAREKVQRETHAISDVIRNAKHTPKNEGDVLRQCIQHKLPYVDMNFPPTRASICADPSGNTSVRLRDLDKLSWRRPRDYLPTSWHHKINLYNHGVRPSEIDQGALGDCWLLCSIAAVAESRRTITSIFINPHMCCRRRRELRAGAHHVTLNLHGMWRTMLLDDYLPAAAKLPCFARTRRHPCDLWVSLLEKGYAKAYGSYAAIAGGSPSHALQDLTGFPTLYLKTLWDAAVSSPAARERFFAQLHAWHKRDYLLTVDTPGTDLRSYLGRRQLSVGQTASMEELFRKAGLAQGHAYSVLDVKHFPLHQLCLLKIRNPWGNEVEWRGDWSDESEMWKRYPLIKALCRPKKRADGVFWMEWKDVVSFFEDGSVCFYQPNYHDYRFPGIFNGLTPNVTLELVVKKSFTAWVMLSQKDTRALQQSDPDSQYTGLLINLCATQGGRQTVQCCSSEIPEEPSSSFLFLMAKSVALKYEFKPEGSPYYIIPRRMKRDGPDAVNKHFVLGLLMSSKITASKVEVNVKQLDEKCRIFGNYPTFDTKGARSVVTTFQYKPPMGFPKMCEGSSVHNAKKSSSSKYMSLID